MPRSITIPCRTVEVVAQFSILPRTRSIRLSIREGKSRHASSHLLVDRVFVSDDQIYPCVDIGVGDLSDGGTPIIMANVAGYTPRPFQKNWTGRDGPFVFIVGQRFLDKCRRKE
jgi:hypothetical protein